MEIKINFPETYCLNEDTSGVAVKHWLKQIELSVHHAQKALEEVVKMNGELETPSNISGAIRVRYVETTNEESGEGNPTSVWIEIYTD